MVHPRTGPNRKLMPARHPSVGFTLLELMLALALTAVVLIAVNMAVNLHLRLFHSRRSFLEESQLAREVLRMVADDIRSAVVPYEQDVSSISQLMGTTSSSGGGADGGGGDSSSGSGSPSDGSSGAGGSGSTGSTGGGQQSSGGQSSGGTQPSGEETGGSTETSEDMSSLLGDESATTSTEDLATSIAVTSQPGIYGNQYELQVDVSRLPRPDQMLPSIEENPVSSIVDIPSDLKTVTYYMLNNSATDISAQPELAVDDLSQADDPSVIGHGLVRRQLDRCVTEWALSNGNASSLVNEGEVIAPEAISIEFMYFDGLEWQTEWDSEANGGVPMAIQVILAFGDLDSMTSSSITGMSSASSGLENVRYYRTIIHLPVAKPQEEGTTTDQSTSTGMESTGL